VWYFLWNVYSYLKSTLWYNYWGTKLCIHTPHSNATLCDLCFSWYTYHNWMHYQHFSLRSPSKIYPVKWKVHIELSSWNKTYFFKQTIECHFFMEQWLISNFGVFNLDWTKVDGKQHMRGMQFIVANVAYWTSSKPPECMSCGANTMSAHVSSNSNDCGFNE